MPSFHRTLLGSLRISFSLVLFFFSLSQSPVLSAPFIDTVLVGNQGNAAKEVGATATDTRWFKTGSFGSVSYGYRIGTTEVTNDQYVTFLNAVASADPLLLYNPSMGTDSVGGIDRSGVEGSYTYASKPHFGNKPVNYVTLWDAMRFTNWLHNGMPSGAQDYSTTEDGAYFLGFEINPSILDTDFSRDAFAEWFLPSEDEWFKAAYHKNDGITGNYYDYPTASDDVPIVATADAFGNVSNPGSNVANYARGARWNGSFGNVTTVRSAGTTSAYGTFDQAGNVDEFSDTLLLCVDAGCSTETSQNIDDLVGETIFRRSIVRSGTWDAFNDFHIVGILNGNRDLGGPNGALPNLGFRVATLASLPEPTMFETTWTEAAGGLFSEGSNWGAGKPNAGDDALFDNAGGAMFTVTFDPGLTTNANLTISNEAVRLDLTNALYRLTEKVTLGRTTGDNAVLQIASGTFMSADAFVARESGSTGTVIVDGTDSVWTNTGSLYLGGSSTLAGGLGTLDVTNGGQVNVAGTTKLWSNAALNLDGGTLTTGSFDGSNASLVFEDGDLIIDGGTFNPGTNDLELDGAAPADHPTLTLINSSTTTNTLFVGRSNQGTLNIFSGSSVSSNTGLLGAFSSGSTGVATVKGPGSRWDNSGSLAVGTNGNGTLNIEGEGVVSTTEGIIGTFLGVTGVAVVTGAGSRWDNSGSMVVGNNGNGTLTVENGGVVTNTEGTIGNFLGSIGVATVAGTGSRWDNSSALHVGGGSSAAGGIGILNVQNGGHVDIGGTLKVWNAGTVTLDGGNIAANTIDHTDGGTLKFLDGTLSTDVFAGDLTQNGGTLLSGSSPSIIDVTGSYNLLGGALEIQLFTGGSAPVAGADFDRLTAESITLAGALNLTAAPSYSPTLGDMFTIISTTGSVSGSFSEVIAYLTGGFTVDVNYGANEVTLVVVAATLGDFNLDDQVDGADFLSWQRGETASRFSLTDLADWQANVVGAQPLASSSTAIPEPSSFALITLGLLGIGHRRRTLRPVLEVSKN